MEQDIGFSSDGLGLKGVLHVPEGAGRPRPAIILCHGFGGSCRNAGHPELAQAAQAEAGTDDHMIRFALTLPGS